MCYWIVGARDVIEVRYITNNRFNKKALQFMLPNRATVLGMFS